MKFFKYYLFSIQYLQYLKQLVLQWLTKYKIIFTILKCSLYLHCNCIYPTSIVLPSPIVSDKQINSISTEGEEEDLLLWVESLLPALLAREAEEEAPSSSSPASIRLLVMQGLSALHNIHFNILSSDKVPLFSSPDPGSEFFPLGFMDYHPPPSGCSSCRDSAPYTTYSL